MAVSPIKIPPCTATPKLVVFFPSANLFDIFDNPDSMKKSLQINKNKKNMKRIVFTFNKSDPSYGFGFLKEIGSESASIIFSECYIFAWPLFKFIIMYNSCVCS